MKLRFQKDDIVNGISIVMKAVPSKTTMSILECILIDASSGEIKLTGNDMELGIETTVNGEILEHGKIALDAKLFSEITRRVSSQNAVVTIESDDKFNTTISCENSVFNIQGRDGDEFSYIPYIEKNKYISLSQFTLKEVIQQTIFSISPNDSNKMMAGELFEVNENQLKVVSLDGHRISIRNVTLKDHYENTKVIVPGKTLSEISKILGGDNEKEVLIYFSANHILFEFDQTIVVSRLIEGEYFRINQMLSSDYETKVTINKKEFLDCIERATILIRENDKKAVIVVGTPTWSQDVDQAAADPIKGENLMYALHFYAATHKADLRNKMTAAINKGLPVFVTEYGICDASGNGAIDKEEANRWVQTMDEYGVSYIAWNLSNKQESSSIIKSSCSKVSGFKKSDLSDEGKWLYSMLRKKAGLTK